MDRRTDRHDEASSRLQQFCGERAYKPLTELRDLQRPSIRYMCFPKIHGKTIRTVAVATARQSLAFDHMSVDRSHFLLKRPDGAHSQELELSP